MIQGGDETVAEYLLKFINYLDAKHWKESVDIVSSNDNNSTNNTNINNNNINNTNNASNTSNINNTNNNLITPKDNYKSTFIKALNLKQRPKDLDTVLNALKRERGDRKLKSKKQSEKLQIENRRQACTRFIRLFRQGYFGSYYLDD